MPTTSDAMDLRVLEDRLAVHYAAATVLAGASSLDEVLIPLMETVCRRLGWQVGTFWSVDADDDVLRCHTVWHDPAIAIPSFEAHSRAITFAKGHGLPGRVWESRVPTAVADVASDANLPRAGMAEVDGLHGSICFPVAAGPHVYGVIEFFSRGIETLDDDLVQTLTALGSHIGQFVERTHIEASRHEAEARRAAMLETSLDAVITMDAAGNVVDFNQAAEHMFGYQRSDVLGQEMANLIIPPEYRESHRGGLAHYLATGEGPFIGRRVEVTAIRADGSIFPVELAITRVPTNGSPLFTGYIRDITEHRRLERRTHEALDALLTMSAALVDIDPPVDAESQSPSPAVAERLVQLTGNVLECRRVMITAIDAATGAMAVLATAGLDPQLDQGLRAYMASTNLYDAQDNLFTTRLLSGETAFFDFSQPPLNTYPNPFELTGVLVASMHVRQQLVGMLAIDFQDVAHVCTTEELALAAGIGKLAALVIERERLLKEREDARASAGALREANRRMTEFISIAGHEMRTPLTTIKGNLQLAQLRVGRLADHEGYAADMVTRKLVEAARLLGRTETQVSRLGRLIDDLLDVSRIAEGRLHLDMSVFDMTSLVRDVVDEYRPLAEDRVLRIDIPDEVPVPVRADSDRVSQVLVNYLSNAFKYAPADKPIIVGVRRDGDRARVWVRDQGPGIAPEDQPRIWERFYRVAGDATHFGSAVGLGLGLHISGTIIAQHGGDVGVESTPGQGALFWFSLPLAGVYE